MSFEEQIRRSLAERAGAVRTSPDEADLARRIRRSYRAADRTQTALRVAALVVVAASAGGLVGAYANHPRQSLQVQQAVEHPGDTSGQGTTDQTGGAGGSGATGGSGNIAPAGGGSAPTTTAPSPGSPAVSPDYSSSPRKLVTSDGLTVDWVVSPAASQMALPLGGGAYACASPEVVSLTVSKGAPLASGTGVIGLPGVTTAGLAFVASGSFETPDKAEGWWTVLEAGPSISTVAVEFPWGEIERASSGAYGGVAVVAGVAPSGYQPPGSAFASAVAEDAYGQSQSSIGFYLGGDPVVSGEATPTPGTCRPTARLVPAPPGPGVQAPADPVVATGSVVQAFEQAYTVNPIFGVAGNLAAVAISPQGGCSVVVPAPSHGIHPDSVSLPGATVYAVVFESPASALVVYRLTGGLVETGTAVLDAGSWKVSQSTYCLDMRS